MNQTRDRLATVTVLRPSVRGVPEADTDPRPSVPPSSDDGTAAYWSRMQLLRQELTALSDLDDAS